MSRIDFNDTVKHISGSLFNFERKYSLRRPGMKNSFRASEKSLDFGRLARHFIFRLKCLSMKFRECETRHRRITSSPISPGLDGSSPFATFVIPYILSLSLSRPSSLLSLSYLLLQLPPFVPRSPLPLKTLLHVTSINAGE